MIRQRRRVAAGLVAIATLASLTTARAQYLTARTDTGKTTVAPADTAAGTNTAAPSDTAAGTNTAAPSATATATATATGRDTAAPSVAAAAKNTVAPADSSAATTSAAPPATGGYSAAGLYNLGNAYARAGKPGLAVLNYERAGLLAPSDPDIEANLRVVREAAKVPSGVTGRFERIATAFTPQTLYWTGLIGILLGGASMLLGLGSSRFRWLRRTGLAVGMALLAQTVANGWVLWPTLHAAVVLRSATPVRVSPVPMGDPLFELPEAATVAILDQHEGFLLIRSRDGRTGWVAVANVAPVVPTP